VANNNTQWNDIKQALEKRFFEKKIIIVGFGREGISTYRLLKKLSMPYELYIMDQEPTTAKGFLATLQDEITVVLPKEDYLKDLDTYDVIFKTPGLPGFLLKTIASDKILSQADLFMEYMGAYSIGVTGTKGKSTTSSLIAHVLSGLGIQVNLVGNIGYPALECLVNHKDGQMYVYEMSSFQTEFLHHGPHIRVILNLFEEHLNNYESYRAYQDSKLQLFLAQSALEHGNDLCIYGSNNQLLRERVAQMDFDKNQSVETFGYKKNNVLNHPGVFLEDSQIYYTDAYNQKISYGTKEFQKELIGEHNLLNSLVVINIIHFLQQEGKLDYQRVKPRDILKLIGTFKGLEHRLEKVATYQGITFYNDSISTIPEATLQAIGAIDTLKTLIIGGFDRGIDYVDFTKKLLTFKQLHIVCLPDTGHKIYQWAKQVDQEHVLHRWHQVQTVDEAVKLAYALTPVGYSCLLSPAASSYNCYKNFEERGDHFKDSVHKEGQRK